MSAIIYCFPLLTPLYVAPQATFEKLENELKEINTNQEALKKNFLELTELKHILRRTQQFFDEVSLTCARRPCKTMCSGLFVLPTLWRPERQVELFFYIIIYHYG